MVVGHFHHQCSGDASLPNLHWIPDHDGCGCLGFEQSDRVGLGDCQFRFLDRYWPRGDLDLGCLVLLRQKWRTSINRAAEAMTIFAVMCAGIFPGIHVGRIWYAWWLFPLPNSNGPIWPQFRSPLLWDVFAVSTYFTVSFLFWYMGLIPDLATIRDRCKNFFSKFFYGLFSLGWTGSNRHWRNYEKRIYYWLVFPHRWCFRSTVSFLSTLPCLRCLDGIPPSSHLTSWPGLFFPDSAWC